MRKFFGQLILGIPLIVLQYYKPSLFLYINIKGLYIYIYIYRKKDHKLNLFYKFNCENLLKFSAALWWVGKMAELINCKFIYNFDSADLLRLQDEALKFG